MSSHPSLRQLAERLPNSQINSWREKRPDPAFIVDSVAVPNYVWPDIDLSDPAPGSVLLISAPGAMGKSAAASAIAERIRAPRIDLAFVPVGAHSLTGLLTSALGWGEAPELVKAVREGSTALVLDSLDEAYLAAGATHFRAFLEDVADLLAGAEPLRQVIIFGRRDTIDTTYLELVDLGVKVEMATIAPLSHSQACEMIDYTLDSQSWTVHRQHAEPFARLRDAELLSMGRALGSVHETVQGAWDDAGDFLGYPPVVLVVAESLKVENPNSGGGSRGATVVGNRSARGNLLRTVVENILDREARKVQHQLAAKLDMKEPELSLLYSRDEQILRIVAFSEDRKIVAHQPAVLSDAQRIEYEESIATFVPDHPFLEGRKLRNTVFKDYMNAFFETSPTASAGIDRGSSAVSGNGPFFCHFVYAMAAGKAEGEIAPISEDLVDSLIKSFESGSQTPTSFFYTSNQNRALLLLTESSYSSHQHDLGFSIDSPSGVLVLNSPVSRGFVTTESGVSITTQTDEVVLGPNLVVFCDELEIGGQRITVQQGKADKEQVTDGVFLTCTTAVSHATDLKLSVPEVNSLRVLWPSPQYQWRGYVPDHAMFENKRMKPGSMWLIVFGIRRILLCFKTGSGSNPSVNADFVNRFAIGGNRLYEAVLAALIEKSLVSKEPGLYRLRQSQLSEYGVNWAQLRGADFSDTLRQLATDLLATPYIWPLVRAEDDPAFE